MPCSVQLISVTYLGIAPSPLVAVGSLVSVDQRRDGVQSRGPDPRCAPDDRGIADLHAASRHGGRVSAALFRYPPRGRACRFAHLHTMFVHWRRSPLPLALFPPPSITPRTASMPRSPFRTARFLVSFVVRPSTSKPSSLEWRARLRRRSMCLAWESTCTPSEALRTTTLWANRL